MDVNSMKNMKDPFKNKDSLKQKDNIFNSNKSSIGSSNINNSTREVARFSCKI